MAIVFSVPLKRLCLERRILRQRSFPSTDCSTNAKPLSILGVCPDSNRRSRRHLKAELQRLRKRGALRPGLDPERSCARCLSPLGRVLNRGAQCPSCRKKVCKDCRLYNSGTPNSPGANASGAATPPGNPNSANNATQWICILCQKQL